VVRGADDPPSRFHAAPPAVPTYEYRCPSGHDFEHFVLRMSEAQSIMACPTCGKSAERRISAGGGLLFKGSGFYITDYGKDGKKDQRAKTAASKPAESGFSGDSAPKTADAKTEPKTDTKVATKSETKASDTTSSAKKDA
jgi:putative FmdB family regulatory protein